MRKISHEDLYKLSSYFYELPTERIAQSPANPRDSSRLLIWDTKSEEINYEHRFKDIINFLEPDDLLVLNNTKVIPARIICNRKSGGKTEIFLLNPLNENYLEWEVLVKPARKIHKDSEIEISDYKIRITGEKDNGIRTIKFTNIESRNGIIEFLEKYGKVPLPPYIKNNDSNKFRNEYQTVFAKNEGSVAAPTASLHFTETLLEEIKLKGIKIAYVTLHVGLGTFRPVQSEDIREHKIHTEHCEISMETVNAIKECKKKNARVIASGTTAARTLESFCKNDEITHGILNTDLFIYPGYKFKIVDALITNFHLPESSLIMLVASFLADKSGYYGREEIMLSKLLDTYEFAALNNWRFFSFGDAMFIK